METRAATPGAAPAAPPPATAPSVGTPRAVERIVPGLPTSDGAGVRMTRLLTAELQRRLDPFLMLDRFGTDNPGDYIGGFPDHPHRGFETVTYMLQGRMRHRDSAGNDGLLAPGGVQWMTAGRGVIHSEMPEQQEGAMEGFQLWLNLPARDKLCTPWYRDFAPDALPLWRGPGATARVIAGRVGGVAGAVQREATAATFVDVELEPGASFALPLPAAHNAFVVGYRGTVAVGPAPAEPLPPGALAILANTPGSDGVLLRAQGAVPARAIVVAGRPLREPIAQWGPFVMNTRAQLLEAIDDFNAGRFAA